MPNSATREELLCNEDLRRRILTNLCLFSVESHNRDGMRRAAVAVTVVSFGKGETIYEMPFYDPCHAALVLTRRSSQLKKHAGQWALPGGTIDAGESAEETALRELEEEVGAGLQCDSILGRLDDFTTRSGFTITPVVIWGGEGLKMQANYHEVDSIHRIPVGEFLREDAPVLQRIPGSAQPVLLMPVGQGWIASPTGAIIYQFREVALMGRSVRVSHYEQPHFAWK